MKKSAESVKWKSGNCEAVYDVCRHLNRILELLDEVQENPKQDNALMLKIVYAWVEEAQERLMKEIIPFPVKRAKGNKPPRPCGASSKKGGTE